MPTDATGSPTALGIPKFDTSVDAPSGLGFNATMDALDTLLTSLTRSGFTSSAPSDADIPVWDTATGRWKPSSAKNPSIPGQASVLTGMIFPYGGTAAPAQYLLCDGSAVSRTTYSALFGVVGTSFGVGNGTTTFNVPDLRGRGLVGYAPSGGHADVNAIGLSDGIALASRRPKHAHTNGLTLPDHGHAVSDPGHAHSFSSYDGVIKQGSTHGPQNSGGFAADDAHPTIAAATTGISIGSVTSTPAINGSIGAAGMTDTAGYQTCNFIIKF